MSDLLIITALSILKLKAVLFIFKNRNCTCKEKTVRLEKAIKKIINKNKIKK